MVYTYPVLGIRFRFIKTGLSLRQYKTYDAIQPCIRVNIFTDKAPYNINLSVSCNYTDTAWI